MGGLSTIAPQAAIIDTTGTNVEELITNTGAIKNKTDNLPVVPAAQGDITAAHAITDGKIDTAQADVTAIKAKTDLIPANPASQTDVNSAHTVTDGKIDALSAKVPNQPTMYTGTWTPAAGKKFRLNAYEITANVTVAGTLVIKDGTTVIKTFQAAVGTFAIARNLLGNGYLSATINNALSCVVDTATATIQANWEGSEE